MGLLPDLFCHCFCLRFFVPQIQQIDVNCKYVIYRSCKSTGIAISIIPLSHSCQSNPMSVVFPPFPGQKVIFAEAKMKEPEPYRDADIWFSETEEEEETQWDPTEM